MRLWSLHPAYLDTKGLLACWREGLLARKVLAGGTRGYTNHPQLVRFRACPDPLAAVDEYLGRIVDEADARGYRFDRAKLESVPAPALLPVTEGQLAFERGHLLAKLGIRDPDRAAVLAAADPPRPHPSFRAVPGPVEAWERGAG